MRYQIGDVVVVSISGLFGTVTSTGTLERKGKPDIPYYYLDGLDINPKAAYGERLLSPRPLLTACGITKGNGWQVSVWKHSFIPQLFCFSYSLCSIAGFNPVTQSQFFGCHLTAQMALGDGIKFVREQIEVSR